MTSNIPQEPLLFELLHMQKILMKKLGHDTEEQDVNDKVHIGNGVAMVSELSEFLNVLNDANFKPWKRKAIDKKKLKEEYVDILFFWLQGAILLGMSSREIFDIYLAKHQVNMTR